MDGYVSIKQHMLRTSIERASNLTIQAKGEAELITSLWMGKNILGMDPIFRPLGQKIRIIWQLILLQLPGISTSQTKS